MYITRLSASVHHLSSDFEGCRYSGQRKPAWRPRRQRAEPEFRYVFRPPGTKRNFSCRYFAPHDSFGVTGPSISDEEKLRFDKTVIAHSAYSLKRPLRHCITPTNGTQPQTNSINAGANANTKNPSSANTSVKRKATDCAPTTPVSSPSFSECMKLVDMGINTARNAKGQTRNPTTSARLIVQPTTNAVYER